MPDGDGDATRPAPPGRCPFLVSIGPLLLGALTPADRDQVQAHLPGCRRCHDELVHLAALPGLLARAARVMRPA
jgi:anti-sigma factor RsiW